ncbi:radical SAM protein [Xanthobacteraceae bacterium Astr-EGSB]|uniref:radical SAM protein n=1 Tax=Astrobacterium formosum TaxID=3069710 RepID=UPI0027B5F268|nr:radical SAM protein [Xanthobacteraceae bacterium Astr-EGSB]
MSMGFLRRLFGISSGLSFFAWQVEMTTRCPLQCRMCIREAQRGWRPADMPIDKFRKLAPYFGLVENTVLQGWGEPLMHPHLIDAIRIVKDNGSRPGFVTSGWGLDTSMVAELAGNGLDFIGFSLAGATPKTHDAIRRNSHLPAVLDAICEFNRFKADNRRETPRMHIVFLMLKDNIAEIPMLLDLARRVGIDVVMLINLIQVSDAWQDDQKVFSCGRGEAWAVIEEARIKAKELDIALQISSLNPEVTAVCGDDPLRNLFIAIDGQVSPCVYLHPPVPSPVKRIFCGEPVSVEKLSFGNIFDEPLEQIWTGQDYVAFRSQFQKRRDFVASHPYDSIASPEIERLMPGGGVALPEPPAPCLTCHRRLGL